MPSSFSAGLTDLAVVRPPLVKLDEVEIARISDALEAAHIGQAGAAGLGPTAIAAE